MFVLRRLAENLSNTMFSKAYIIQILSLVPHETGSTVIVRTVGKVEPEFPGLFELH